MPFHLSLCPVHVSIHTTSDGKASSSVRLDVLDFHLDSTSNSVHKRVRSHALCNLSISRCSIPRHATHYLHTGEKSQTKPKPLLMKRKISLASRCWSHTVKPEVSPVRSTDATSEAFRSPHPPVGKQTQPPRTRCYCPHYRAKPSARIPQYFPLALVKSQSPPSIQTEAPTTRAKPNKRRFRLRPRRKGNRAAYRPPPLCWMFL